MKKYIKKYTLFVLLFVCLVNCKNFFYGSTYRFYYVKDFRYWQYGIPSYQVNTNDRYCAFYTDRINNIYFTDNIDNKIQEKNNYDLMISFLKNKNVKIKKEPLFKFDGKTTKDKTLEIIKQRELDNNFENCDYLIEFSLHDSKDYKGQIVLWISIDDIKTNKNIGFYTMREMDTIFKKTTQEQKVEKMLNEWWKTQIKPQPKARPLETWCVGNCDNKL